MHRIMQKRRKAKTMALRMLKSLCHRASPSLQIQDASRTPHASRLAEVLICALSHRGIPLSTPQAYAVGTLGLYIAKHFAADQCFQEPSK